MCKRFILLLLWFACAAPAASSVDEEIEHLMKFLDESECRFFRNGEWHESSRAVRHLNRKYNYLRRRNLVPDTEAFIERAASESSVTGEAYLVDCPGAAPVPSAQWLSEELGRYRTEDD